MVAEFANEPSAHAFVEKTATKVADLPTIDRRKVHRGLIPICVDLFIGRADTSTPQFHIAPPAGFRHADRRAADRPIEQDH